MTGHRLGPNYLYNEILTAFLWGVGGENFEPETVGG
jgi:hypothetical protein